jgi:hypothetical protein
VTVMVIAIGIVVVVIPIGADATTDATIRTNCCRCRDWAPNADVSDAPAAPPLPPPEAMDPTAAATMKTCGGTKLAVVMATAKLATMIQINTSRPSNF